MSYPQDLKYTKDHEWVSTPTGNQVAVGVSSYAIEQLGDIVHIDLPEVGESFAAGASFGTIESTKTVSDLYMPVAGKIAAVNDKVLKNPETLQTDSYKDGWLVKIETAAGGAGQLMDAKAYEAYLQSSH